MALIYGRIPSRAQDPFWPGSFLINNDDDSRRLCVRQPAQRKCSCKSSHQSQRHLKNQKNVKNGPMTIAERCFLPSVFGEQVILSEENKDMPLVSMENSKDALIIKLKAHQFKPEEMKIEVKEGYLHINVKHEEKSEDGSSFSSEQFTRAYALPKNVKTEDITSKLSSEGILQIIAPKIDALKDDSETSIPIEISK
uniref:Heat shock protein beta-1 n=1 Tax=Caligus clemensi TaxID=344056 RepID=C1C1T4_CALCM|nr:Heat shock protein beta-1 [Caligus clemensi]